MKNDLLTDIIIENIFYNCIIYYKMTFVSFFFAMSEQQNLRRYTFENLSITTRISFCQLTVFRFFGSSSNKIHRKKNLCFYGNKKKLNFLQLLPTNHFSFLTN